MIVSSEEVVKKRSSKTKGDSEEEHKHSDNCGCETNKAIPMEEPE
jgi:hypothetical protein